MADTLHYNYVESLRMYGALPPLPHVFMTWCLDTGTTLPFL